MKFPFGKYQEHEVKDVISFDRPYCEWVLRQNDIKRKFEEFCSFLQAELESSANDERLKVLISVMPFGKYEDEEFEDFILDESYCKWLLKTPSFELEYPEHRAYLQQLYNLVYTNQEDSKFLTFYVLFFKNAYYIKVGRTSMFIVKRIYGYAGVSTIYSRDNIDLEKSFVVRTNYKSIEKNVLNAFAKSRLDSQSERLFLDVENDVIEYINALIKSKTKFNFSIKPLSDYIPFSDGFHFRDSFTLKINQFLDFEILYIAYLKENGLHTKYNPFQNQSLN